MNNDIITHLIIGGIIGFIIGIILISTISPKARRYKKVKRELDEAQEALNTQKQIIVKHFSHSAIPIRLVHRLESNLKIIQPMLLAC